MTQQHRNIFRPSTVSDISLPASCGLSLFSLSLLSLSLLCLITLLSACNPFAPALEEGDPFGTLLGDPATIDGFFANFEAAYELRDISLYEQLLDSSFTFTYFDFDIQVERQWGFLKKLSRRAGFSKMPA